MGRVLVGVLCLVFISWARAESLEAVRETSMVL